MHHVIVIEDNHLIGDMIADLALTHGASSVAIAASEEEAITLARARRPLLILSDVDLRDGGRGPVAVARIHAELGSIPTIFITGEPDDLDALRLGPTLSKPISNGEFNAMFTHISGEAIRARASVG